MPTLLFCLLTPVEPNAHVNGFVKAFGEMGGGPATLLSAGTFVAAVVAAVWTVVRAVRKQRALDMAEADKPTAPMPVAALPAAVPAQSASAAELQAATAMRMSTEAALLDTQLALRRIRSAMDEQVRANAKAEGELMAANVLAKAENERLRADNAAKDARIAELELKGRALIQQMQSDLAEPKSLPPLPRRLRER